MAKKALLQVSVNHSNGHLVKLYATELNLFYGKYSFALHNLWLMVQQNKGKVNRFIFLYLCYFISEMASTSLI